MFEIKGINILTKALMRHLEYACAVSGTQQNFQQW